MTTGDGLNISGGNFVVTKDGRQVINTAGHLVMGLPSSVQSLSKTLTYPDFNKAYWYNYQWYIINSHFTAPYYYFQCIEGASIYVNALPQEWVQDTVLCAAPTVADGTPLGFLGKIRLNRTTSPSHNVNTATLSMRVPANVWLPNCGSILLESVEFGISRNLTCMISGGNLILRQRQSVVKAFDATATGGYGNYGQPANTNCPAGGNTARGGYWDSYSYDTTNAGAGHHSAAAYFGVIVYHVASSDTTSNTTYPTSSTAPGYRGLCDPYTSGIGAAGIPVFNDPTNYSSIYTVDVQGEFVRLT